MNEPTRYRLRAMTVELQNLEHERWSLASASAVWAFVLPRADGESLQSALRRHTVTHGDDAAEIRPAGAIDMRRCASSRGEEFVIRQGGTLTVVLVESHGRDVRAAANGPRLSEFLRAVRDRMGGKIRENEAASYEGSVTDEGFIEAIESGS